MTLTRLIRRLRRHHRPPRPVVTIHADTTAFTDAMQRNVAAVREAERILVYRSRLHLERYIGLAHVNGEANRIRRELGLDH